ncbi:hypothetical protein ASPWEDRAFT_552217 [Aspergillus wentii DTO 134E9]|uniref:Uncharacterized protein n=1 Tax=Aspergillus wentii DTO 134E9 TaxID=1073089 RepID=A0A1L9RGF0_ASPWE|nr:uncharacterized protein ASPWEDRAFT_552217 [Aspergillus wentii DTO 134E9]OJJ33974.1 hypothetical protein ASPWEDRAFT_552217 [Aspergillus wentii DTO 134E9]
MVGCGVGVEDEKCLETKAAREETEETVRSTRDEYDEGEREEEGGEERKEEEEEGGGACLVGGASVADVRRTGERERARDEAVDTQEMQRRVKGTTGDMRLL